MNEDGCFELIVVCLLCATTGVLGIGTGYDWGKEWGQKAAIKASAGRWVIDAKTGQSRFEYGCTKEHK